MWDTLNFLQLLNTMYIYHNYQHLTYTLDKYQAKQLQIITKAKRTTPKNKKMGAGDVSRNAQELNTTQIKYKK